MWQWRWPRSIDLAMWTDSFLAWVRLLHISLLKKPPHSPDVWLKMLEGTWVVLLTKCDCVG
jgi:hypothetical protein